MLLNLADILKTIQVKLSNHNGIVSKDTLATAKITKSQSSKDVGIATILN